MTMATSIMRLIQMSAIVGKKEKTTYCMRELMHLVPLSMTSNDSTVLLEM